MANKKITDATQISTMSGSDKLFVNSGDDLKQITLDQAVAASTPVQQLNNNMINFTPCIYYDGEGKLSEALDIVKDIHSKYDLHKPSVIKIDSNGIKACIGYNYGTNSLYGAYLYFSVFGELMYIRCHNSIWYSNQIVLVQTTNS